MRIFSNDQYKPHLMIAFNFVWVEIILYGKVIIWDVTIDGYQFDAVVAKHSG